MTDERFVDAPEPLEMCNDEEESGEATLVWNGMVARIDRIPCDGAPATTSTRPAEAAEPIATRSPA